MGYENDKGPDFSGQASKPHQAVAVAIEGNKRNPEDPGRIVAAGRGRLAEEILQIAFNTGIKVRTDADLAELLAKLDLDTPIPSEAIIAVAEILAKVYEANARFGALSSQGDV